MNIAIWILCVLVALPFLGSGGAKLVGTPVMVAIFKKIGFGQWFRILTGFLEITGGMGLLIPPFRRPSAALLAVVMCGAIGFHLTTLGGSPTGPMVLLVASALVCWASGEKTPPHQRAIKSF